jgi:hypothetical protein
VSSQISSSLNARRLDCANIDEVKAMNKLLQDSGLDANAGVDEGQIAVIWDKDQAIENELRALKLKGDWEVYGWDTFQDALYGAQHDDDFWKKVKARGRCTVTEGNTRVT